MNYSEVLDFLFSQLPMFQRVGKSAYKANLDNTILLDNHFGNPHKKFKSIHVAGTNGKGSVSHLLASVLQEAGFKTGLYTSPHLKDFRERIKINGVEISEQKVTEFVNENITLIEKVQPSFFEMTVAMAFKYFADEQVDIAVVEVGMGGRLDSTNIINPLISVITNIGYDHTAFLGDTLDLIAQEKAGIIKPNTKVVIGKTQAETQPVFSEIAKQNNSEIIFVDQVFSCDYSMLSVDNKQIFNVYRNNKLEYENLKIDLLGAYQKENILTVLCAIENLNLNISKAQIYNGLLNASTKTGLNGRWQILNNSPLTVCDTGHNVDGIKWVISQINETAYKNLHMVVGFVNDKEIDSILELFPQNATYYFTKPSIPRGLEVDKLYEIAQKYALNGKKYDSVKEAILSAQLSANKDDMIFIGGSTFVVADIF